MGQTVSDRFIYGTSDGEYPDATGGTEQHYHGCHPLISITTQDPDWIFNALFFRFTYE
jgi:hypothetical protein